MRIGDLARVAGVSVRALRYYEEEGLVRPSRAENGYRCFEERDVEVVRQIRGLIEAGLPTRIIRDVLPYLDGPGELMPEVPCEHMLDEVAAHRDALERRIRCLTRNRDALNAYLDAAVRRSA
ncbi:MerR family transcriptional regulator [Saccharothrix sp.]|uniref:MerR family transcriptional regulator n=1 Tax=Saccharothrix sp. TaxID=1873460 RepID=UPI00281155A0|nr:MerR family transcriptional regulator [Saccharothrix sp.]